MIFATVVKLCLWLYCRTSQNQIVRAYEDFTPLQIGLSLLWKMQLSELTLRAYTFGVLYFVEVDIELPEELPLKEAHAIGETLQIKLEKLPEVERAFVHLDFECITNRSTRFS
ncbi:hypothetical protein PIB30_064867 [Stylosanthes scabra]|uniref:Cation efflux protein cytoplasmic domain-containing protein n=1 Tax=Stylosanthes scabra TaxID=79078 RepID=A0ABU6XKT2_9FABA|nr:hypothetical protein [Stylosanthes scabra]